MLAGSETVTICHTVTPAPGSLASSLRSRRPRRPRCRPGFVRREARARPGRTLFASRADTTCQTPRLIRLVKRTGGSAYSRALVFCLGGGPLCKDCPSTSDSSRYSAVAAWTAAGRGEPSRCQARHPSTIHRSTPGSSSRTVGQRGVRGGQGHSQGGTSTTRRQMPLPLSRMTGRWLVDTQRVCRAELEEVPPHETGRDGVAAGELFDQASLSPAPAGSSDAAASRVPQRVARSVGWASPLRVSRRSVGICRA